MTYGWEGEKVRLVPLDRDKHLDNALKWFNDPDITATQIGEALPGGQRRLFVRWQGPDTGRWQVDRAGSVGLGQTVQVGEIETGGCHLVQHRLWRWCRGVVEGDGMVEFAALFGLGVQ